MILIMHFVVLQVRQIRFLIQNFEISFDILIRIW